MKEYTFIIPGEPISWQRARRNGHRYFDPQLKQKHATQLKIEELMQKMPINPFPVAQPIHALFEFWFQYP